MALDLHLICTREGELATFKRALFEEIMGREAIDPQFPLYNVVYSDGGCWDIDETSLGEDDTSMINFSHFHGDTFFDLLRGLADRAGAFLYWPGEGRTIAAPNRDVLAQVPPEMCTNGPPYVVKNGRELYDTICGIDPEALPG